MNTNFIVFLIIKMFAKARELSEKALAKKEEVSKINEEINKIKEFEYSDFIDLKLEIKYNQPFYFINIDIKHSKNKSDKIEVLTIDDIPTVKEITNSLFNGDNMINPDAITEESLKKTAIHEIGHAFLRYNAYDSPEIIKITINSEGTGALGYVQMKVKEGEYTKTKSKMLKDIMILLGGMASEEVFLGEFANGNSSDLEKATTIAYNMVTKYGMSKLGYGRIFKVDGEMTTIVQNEVNDILKECYEQAIKLIKTNKTKMTKVIDYLYEHKEIDEETFIKVFNE